MNVIIATYNDNRKYIRRPCFDWFFHRSVADFIRKRMSVWMRIRIGKVWEKG